MLSGHTEGSPTRPVGSSRVPDNAGKHVPSGNKTGNHITSIELWIMDNWCSSAELGHCICHARVHIMIGICKVLSVFPFLHVAIIHFSCAIYEKCEGSQVLKLWFFVYEHSWYHLTAVFIESWYGVHALNSVGLFGIEFSVVCLKYSLLGAWLSSLTF